MYDLNRFHPLRNEGALIRLGRDYDGGYVISKEQIQKTELLLSFGVNDDWSFEIDFEKEKKIKILAFDYSVSRKASVEKIRDCIGYAIGGLLIFRRSWIINSHRDIKYTMANRKEIKKYFIKENDRYLIPKYLNNYNDEKNITFDSIFKDLSNIKNLSVFIKMDIEGAEYKSLPHLLPYFDKINGMAIEFHDLNKQDCLDDFKKMTEMILEHFEVIHIHGNTYGGTIMNTLLPVAPEITFINKDMLSKNRVKSMEKYPIRGLDFPNGQEEPCDFQLPYNYGNDIDNIVCPYKQVQ